MFSSAKRLVASLAFTSIAMTGCYVVPINKEGAYSVYPAGSAPEVAQAPVPSALNVRLYPANDAAGRTGVLIATVTNMHTGKGRFQLNYRGETLNGEATRSSDQKHGIANAYGPSGTYLSCEYEMTSARQGNGECSMSDGARYQAHIGG